MQASAADWTAVMLAALRRRLLEGAAPGAEIVFFQHDEVVLHCPADVGARGGARASPNPRRRRPGCCSVRRRSAFPSRARRSPATRTPSSTVHCGPKAVRRAARRRNSARMAGTRQSYGSVVSSANRCPQATRPSTDGRLGLPRVQRREHGRRHDRAAQLRATSPIRANGRLGPGHCAGAGRAAAVPVGIGPRVRTDGQDR